MLKRTFVTLASFAALAAATAPAFADTGLGFDPYYVENPSGREVVQTHQAAATAFGYDAWYVPGPVDSTAAGDGNGDQRSVARTHRSLRETQAQPGHAYAVPAFGPQADA